MENLVVDLLRTYKIPLIFAGAGLVFLLIAIVISSGSKNSESMKNGVVIIDTDSEATASGQINGLLVIDIEGAVVRPGVYEMEEGSRVVDLLERAGGIADGANQEWIAQNLNKAQPLVDGVKIYIPFRDEILNSKSKISNTSQIQNSTSLININAASLEELETLSGIGPVTAEEIIDGRPYTRVEELLERKIVGHATWEKVRNQISVF